MTQGDPESQAVPETLYGDPVPSIAAELDRDQLERRRFQRLQQERLIPGILAGLAAAMIGAGVWGAIGFFTGYEIGWVAIGVGFLVGIAVQKAGRGASVKFGVIGALLALLGVVGGKYLTIVAVLSQEFEIPMGQMMGQLASVDVVMIFTQAFSVIDLLFYGLAIWEGYQLSFEDLDKAIAKGELATA